MSGDNWDIPVNWRERAVDPASFAFLTSSVPHTDEELRERAIIRTAKELSWMLLLKRVDELAEIFLTTHQKKVYELWIKRGNTYQEIGAILSRANGYSCEYSAYTAISHCIKGIRSNKHGGKYHGGIENRLRKRCEKDEVFQKLLIEWQTLQQDKLAVSLEYLNKHDKWYAPDNKQLHLETV